MKRRDLEGPVHMAILEYLRLRFPAAVIHHAPNENTMKGPAVARMIAKFKKKGMLTGFPDLMVVARGAPTLFFEVKAGNPATTEQKQVGEQLTSQGAHWALVRSIDDVQAALDRWGVV